MRQALRDYLIAGIKTTVSFLYEVMGDPRFLAGDADTTFIDTFCSAGKAADPSTARWRWLLPPFMRTSRRRIGDLRSRRHAPSPAPRG
jgi:acetyl/propionyl-CoA carboxylase alpha subunit